MSREHIITRQEELVPAALINGVLPAGVTYFVMPGPYNNLGESPYGEYADSCPAALVLVPKKDRQRTQTPADGLWCTRAAGHDGQHIAHAGPGIPLAAWVDDLDLLGAPTL